MLTHRKLWMPSYKFDIKATQRARPRKSSSGGLMFIQLDWNTGILILAPFSFFSVYIHSHFGKLPSPKAQVSCYQFLFGSLPRETLKWDDSQIVPKLRVIPLLINGFMDDHSRWASDITTFSGSASHMEWCRLSVSSIIIISCNCHMVKITSRAMT